MSDGIIRVVDQNTRTPAVPRKNGIILIVMAPMEVAARACKLANGLYVSFNRKWKLLSSDPSAFESIIQRISDLEGRVDELEAVVNTKHPTSDLSALHVDPRISVLHHLETTQAQDYFGNPVADGDRSKLYGGYGIYDSSNKVFSQFNNDPYIRADGDGVLYWEFDGSTNHIISGAINNSQGLLLYPRFGIQAILVCKSVRLNNVENMFAFTNVGTNNNFWGIRKVNSGGNNVIRGTITGNGGTATNVESTSDIVLDSTFIMGIRLYKVPTDTLIRFQVYSDQDGWSAVTTATQNPALGPMSRLSVGLLSRTSDIWYQGAVYELILTTGQFWEPSNFGHFNSKYGVTPN